MRDQYGRITPDFDAWKKLGWVCTEIHENCYTLSKENDNSYWEFEQIYFDFEQDSDSPKVTKERLSMEASRNAILDFTPEEQEQVNKDLANYYEEIKKGL